MILNVKQLNKFVSTSHFKLEDRRTAVRLLNKDDFLVTIDLKDAYYTIPIAKKDRTFLRFRFDGMVYEFTYLPFGLATAPFVFTKILKPTRVHHAR